MSWFVSYEVDKKDVTDEGEKALEDFIREGEGHLNDEARTQVVQTMLQVIGLVESGVVGDPFGNYIVSLAGHANPDHKPVEGWANDMVTITIAQKVNS